MGSPLQLPASSSLIISRPISAVMEKCFGVIADIQHADVEDGFDWSGEKRRHYRNSLGVVSAASLRWREEKVKFVAQLGDIVDSKAKKNNSSNTDCDIVLEQLQQSSAEYLVNIIGNHELYNFKRQDLQTKLQVIKDDHTWYSFKPWTDSPLRVVVLDSYDISTIEALSKENTERAKEILSENNPNDFMSFGVNWSLGLHGTDKRYMPYNGALSSAQLAWLEGTLSQAAKEGETAIILCHVPLHPQAAQSKNLLWNYQSVLDILVRSGCVVAVLAGHDHDGGYHHQDGVHHFTLSSPLNCSEGEVAYGTVGVAEEGLQWKWYGDHQQIPSTLKIDFYRNV